MLKMIFDTVFMLVGLVWELVKWPLLIIAIIIALMFVMVLIWKVFLRKKQNIQPKTGERYKVKEDNFFKKLFILAPRQIALDSLRYDPEYFQPQGLVIYVGRQGAGKTISMIHDTWMLQQEYPKAKCISNCGYTEADKDLTDWKEMLNFKNGLQGVIIQMDEIHAWFNSQYSKNMPDDLLAQVSQNRKQRRIWFGTAQVFTRVAKPIREQTCEVRKCTTLFKCITIVHRTEPEIDEDGKVKKYKSRGWYWFVQDDTLREMYNTYKVIESIKKVGALPRSERLGNGNDSNIRENVELTIKQSKK